MLFLLAFSMLIVVERIFFSISTNDQFCYQLQFSFKHDSTGLWSKTAKVVMVLWGGACMFGDGSDVGFGVGTAVKIC